MTKVIEEAQCLSSRLPETYSQLTIIIYDSKYRQYRQYE